MELRTPGASGDPARSAEGPAAAPAMEGRGTGLGKASSRPCSPTPGQLQGRGTVLPAGCAPGARRPLLSNQVCLRFFGLMSKPPESLTKLRSLQSPELNLELGPLWTGSLNQAVAPLDPVFACTHISGVLRCCLQGRSWGGPSLGVGAVEPLPGEEPQMQLLGRLP